MPKTAEPKGEVIGIIDQVKYRYCHYCHLLYGELIPTNLFCGECGKAVCGSKHGKYLPYKGPVRCVSCYPEPKKSK